MGYRPHLSPLFKFWLVFVILSLLFLAYALVRFSWTAYLLSTHERPSQEEKVIVALQSKVDQLETRLKQETSKRQSAAEALENFKAQKETFEVTAYTHTAQPGVPDINGTGTGITASGIPVREGLIAVDPRVIPLGSKVLVEGLGTFLAADTGGAIRGNRLDIFFESRTKALRFGRQSRWAIILP